MACYVDQLRVWPNGRGWWKGRASCHLFADTYGELMAMAERIGLRVSWLQDGGTWREHYDLTEPKRRAAVALGARDITARELSALMRAKRERERATP